jgi:hypothetical protein
MNIRAALVIGFIHGILINSLNAGGDTVRVTKFPIQCVPGYGCCSSRTSLECYQQDIRVRDSFGRNFGTTGEPTNYIRCSTIPAFVGYRHYSFTLSDLMISNLMHLSSPCPSSYESISNVEEIANEIVISGVSDNCICINMTTIGMPQCSPSAGSDSYNPDYRECNYRTVSMDYSPIECRSDLDCEPGAPPTCSNEGVVWNCISGACASKELTKVQCDRVYSFPGCDSVGVSSTCDSQTGQCVNVTIPMKQCNCRRNVDCGQDKIYPCGSPSIHYSCVDNNCDHTISSYGCKGVIRGPDCHVDGVSEECSNRTCVNVIMPKLACECYHHQDCGDTQLPSCDKNGIRWSCQNNSCSSEILPSSCSTQVIEKKDANSTLVVGVITLVFTLLGTVLGYLWKRCMDNRAKSKEVNQGYQEMQ